MQGLEERFKRVILKREDEFFFPKRERERKDGMLLSRKLNISSSKMDVYNCFRIILESFGRDILEKLQRKI